jgi:hypothetical protein
LKSKHINFQDYLNYKDINHIGSAVCDSAVVDDEENSRVRDEVIKNGQLFESLDAIKLFFRTMLYVTIDYTLWRNHTKTYGTS